MSGKRWWYGHDKKWHARGETPVTPIPPSTPTAAFTTQIVGRKVSFDASASKDAGSTLTAYAWTFGDGTAGAGKTLSHTYATDGSFTAVLTVTDANNASATTTQTVTVAQIVGAPTAAFTFTTVNLAAQFDASTSTDPTATLTTYAWKFGDNTTGTGITATHTYAAAGSYTATLVVTDSAGQTASSSHTVAVSAPVANRPPVASFSVTTSGATVTVSGSASTDPDGTVAKWSWTFGDGGTASGATASHTYSNSGTYTIVLTVTDNLGATGTAGKAVPITAPTSPSTPRWDHIVYVWMENHSETGIIGNSAAPYINALASANANFTKAQAEGHPSQPNYIAGFCGSMQGITDDNNHSLGNLPNLYTQMQTAGLSFKGYVESPGVRKHNPWESFSNSTAAEVAFTSWPADYTQLPKVAWVVPNLNDDMHDGTVQQGDTWLQTHIDPYLQWAKTHNSLLIVVWDEDDSNSANGNDIPVIIAGTDVTSGTYTQVINHYDILALIQDSLSIPRLNNTVGLPALTAPFAPGGGTPPPTGWTLAWEDDFTGTTIDGTKWAVDNNSTFGSGNNELEMNMAANATVSNSILKVEARKESVGGKSYTSAHLNSKGKAEFSIGPNNAIRVEVRAQLPDVTHLLPCPAWLRPSDGGNGEVDLIEATGTSDTDNAANTRISQTVHLSYSPSLQNALVAYIDSAHGFTGSNGVKDWHTYAVEIYSDHVTYFVDGKTIGTITQSSSQMNLTPNFGSVFGTVRKWFFHITLGVGGNWPGTPTAATTFPADMNIDWIRVYR